MLITSTGPAVKTSSKYNIKTKKMPLNHWAFHCASIFIRKLNYIIWAWLKPDRFQQIKLSFIQDFSLLLYVVFYILPFQSPHHHSSFCLSLPPQNTAMTCDDPWNVLQALNGLDVLCQWSVSINWPALVVIDHFCSPGCHEPPVRLRPPFSLHFLCCNETTNTCCSLSSQSHTHARFFLVSSVVLASHERLFCFQGSGIHKMLTIVSCAW